MVESLTNCSALAPGKTQINGLSGGAITAVLTTIGKTGREQFNFWRDNLMECGTRYASAVPASCSNASMQCQADVGTCNGHGNSVLKESFYNLFTDQHVKQGESPRRGPGPLHAVCGRPRPSCNCMQRARPASGGLTLLHVLVGEQTVERLF